MAWQGSPALPGLGDGDTRSSLLGNSDNSLDGACSASCLVLPTFDCLFSYSSRICLIVSLSAGLPGLSPIPLAESTSPKVDNPNEDSDDEYADDFEDDF